MSIPDFSLSVFDGYIDSNKLWFSSLRYNALFCFDLNCGNLVYAGSFPGEVFWGNRLYSSVNMYEDKLVFTPCSAAEIGIYDIRQKSFSKVNVGVGRKENNVLNLQYAKKFVSGYIYNHQLILIPACYDSIVKYDLLNQTVHTDSKSVQFVKEKYSNKITSAEGEFYFCWNARRKTENSLIFDLHHNSNCFIDYDLKTGAIKDTIAGSEDNTYIFCEYYGLKVWLYDGMREELIRYDEFTGCYDKVNIGDAISQFGARGDNQSYCNMIACNGYIYLLSYGDHRSVRVDVDTLKVEILDEISSYKGNKGNRAFSSFIKVYERNKLLLNDVSNQRLVIFNTDNFCIDEMDFSTDVAIEQELKKEMVHNLTSQGNVIMEGDLQLKDYIDLL